MTQRLYNIVSISAIIILALALYLQWEKGDELNESILIQESEIAHFKATAELEKGKSDSLKNQIIILDDSIKKAHGSEKRIIRYYEKKINDIRSLSADSSISYFSKRLSEKGNNK